MSDELPPANEPRAYGIGSDHWPGVGKVIEETAELNVELGKLQGSGGNRHHWSGDLVDGMRDEIADTRAALRFLVDANPVLDDGSSYMRAREEWKLALFHAWHRGDPPASWPQPEAWGLPPRKPA